MFDPDVHATILVIIVLPEPHMNAHYRAVTVRGSSTAIASASTGELQAGVCRAVSVHKRGRVARLVHARAGAGPGAGFGIRLRQQASACAAVQGRRVHD